jgi:hypothetical protein
MIAAVSPALPPHRLPQVDAIRGKRYQFSLDAPGAGLNNNKECVL